MRKTLLALSLAAGLGGLLAPAPADAAPASIANTTQSVVAAADRLLDGAVVNEATGVQTVQYYRRYRRYGYRPRYARRYYRRY